MQILYQYFAWVLFINVGFELLNCKTHNVDKRFSFASNLDWYLNSLSTKSVDKKDEEDLLGDEPMMADSPQEIRAETISNCITSVKNEGRFRLTKDAKVPWTSVNQCHLYIFAPVGKVIRISFASVTVNCEKSGIKVIDGITTLKNYQGQIEHLPYGALGRRPIFLCASNSKIFDPIIISSQNYVQIDYKFEMASDEAIVDVSFENSKDVCDSMLTPDIQETVYKLQSSKTRRTCRVYIAGSSILNIFNATLDPEVYDSSRCHSVSASQSYLSLQISNASWKRMPIRSRILPCNTKVSATTDSVDLTGFDRLILPCRFNVLELHSGVEASRYMAPLGVLWKNRQSVQFSVQELPSKDTALLSRFCYKD